MRRHRTALPPVIERLLAGLTLALCIFLLVRLAVGARRRERLDAAVRRAALATRFHAVRLWHWPARRHEAKRSAEEAIRRAKGGTWEGNVYKPRSFRKPPRDKMH